MRRVAVLFTAVMLAACSGASPTPTDTPSVLVSVVRPQRGALPSTLVAYGSTGPSLTGTQTLTEPQAGQVVSLAVSPGASVRAGQMLATFAIAPAARATYQQAVAALAAARKQAATTAQLLTQQLATQDQLTQATKAVTDAETALAALQADGAGRASHSIVAPFDGIITAVTAGEGVRTTAGAPILTIARAGGMIVTVGVDPAQRGAIAAGQPATLVRLSGGENLAGRVVRVDGALNPLTRLVDVDLGFPTGTLLSGEGVRADIETGRVQGWVVPHSSVVTANGPARVFQVVGGKAKAVPVRLAVSSDKGDVVDGPIDPRRPLIVAGAYQVADGDAVRSRD